MKAVPFLFFLFVANLWAAPEAFEVSAKRVGELPGGKEADGILGDYVLRNDRIEAVIAGGDPLRKANMGTFWGAENVTPGCLYDLTPRGANNDQITAFSPSRQQGRVSYVRIVKDGSKGEAVIEAVLTSARSGGLAKRHEYVLREGWRALLIRSTLRNDGADSLSGPVSDKWTNFRSTGKLGEVHWADSIDPADKAGYAYARLPAKDGEAPPVHAKLDAGDELVIERVLAVGASPAEAYSVVARRLGLPVSEVNVSLREPAGAPVTTARVNLTRNGQSVPAYPDELGRIRLDLPRGDWKLEAVDHGRPTVSRSFTLGEEHAKLELAMEPAARITFDVRKEDGSPSPCKAQFIGVEGTPSPNLGPTDRARGCRDQYHAHSGKFAVALAPGKYRVVLTRGIEHDHFEKIVTLPKGETVAITATLRRSVPTPGWVSTDFHNHSTPSGDNVCGTDDRVINLAAEHIEFAPTTEHNRIYDWAPHIEKLGLSKEISTIPGIELTGSGAHLNAFPLSPRPNLQDGGSPVWVKDPRINAINLRNHQGFRADRWIHVNHPDMIENFFDRDKDGNRDGGFDGIVTLLDAIETENYRAAHVLDDAPFHIGRRAGREQVVVNREFVWLQLLNQGRILWGIAVSDAHHVHGNGVGGWRTYVRSSTDEPSKIDWREISRRAKAGQMILTTGPYLEVETLDGVLPGGYARANEFVELKTRVSCPSWIEVDRVQVLVNGRQEPSLNFTRKSHPKLFADGVVKFDQTLRVPLEEDAHLIVVAYGENSDLRVGYGSSAQAGIRPCAYNNPIFVDLDGNGFTPNGDTLGFPLPAGRISVAEAKKQLVRAGKTSD